MTQIPKCSAEIAAIENMDTLDVPGGAGPQEPAAAGTKSTDSSSPVSASQQTCPSKPNTDQSGQSTKQDSTLTHPRRKGGPRTKLGKERSRRNAATHGLTAKIILLEDESPAEFEAFCQEFRDYYRPVGTPQELDVLDLAWVKWCLRRVPAAERAEIELEKRYNSRAADRKKRDREEAEVIEASVDAQTKVDTETARYTKAYVEIPRPGLMERWDNPVIRQRCLDLLKSLHKSIKLRLFFPARDNQIIDKIFGVRTPSEFRLFYSLCAKPGPFKEFDLPLDERLSRFLDYLEEVIDRYERLARRADSDSAKRIRLESESAVVPDRLLRYRAHLERGYDRILKGLLLQQQIRK
jgi:hypothetical protein